MPVHRLRAYLDEWEVPYKTLHHPAAYSAQEVAELIHVPGKEVAKTVMVMIDGRLCMAVVPADYTVDFDRLSRTLGTTDVYLAGEDQFRDCFPDCELGAMPPFGQLYGMPVLVAEPLAEDDEITFSAGTHTELIRMSYIDFESLTRPAVLPFSVHC